MAQQRQWHNHQLDFKFCSQYPQEIVLFSEFREYCIQEEFEATCEEDEVIVIQEARYGRMSIGRCVSADYGNLGCSADVTNYIDTKCSGRHHCEMNVKELIDVAQPCDKDFSSYLQIRHECVKGAA